MIGNGYASSLVQKELGNGQTRASQANNQNFFVIEVFHEPHPLVIKDIAQYVGRLVIESFLRDRSAPLSPASGSLVWANARH
jgi:hypothetical protein